MSDTWNDIQALKNRKLSLREKHLRRKRELEAIKAGITGKILNLAQTYSIIAQFSLIFFYFPFFVDKNQFKRLIMFDIWLFVHMTMILKFKVKTL